MLKWGNSMKFDGRTIFLTICLSFITRWGCAESDNNFLSARITDGSRSPKTTPKKIHVPSGDDAKFDIFRWCTCHEEEGKGRAMRCCETNTHTPNNTNSFRVCEDIPNRKVGDFIQAKFEIGDIHHSLMSHYGNEIRSFFDSGENPALAQIFSAPIRDIGHVSLSQIFSRPVRNLIARAFNRSRKLHESSDQFDDGSDDLGEDEELKSSGEIEASKIKRLGTYESSKQKPSKFKSLDEKNLNDEIGEDVEFKSSGEKDASKIKSLGAYASSKQKPLKSKSLDETGETFKLRIFDEIGDALRTKSLDEIGKALKLKSLGDKSKALKIESFDKIDEALKLSLDDTDELKLKSLDKIDEALQLKSLDEISEVIKLKSLDELGEALELKSLGALNEIPKLNKTLSDSLQVQIIDKIVEALKLKIVNEIGEALHFNSLEEISEASKLESQDELGEASKFKSLEELGDMFDEILNVTVNDLVYSSFDYMSSLDDDELNYVSENWFRIQNESLGSILSSFLDETGGETVNTLVRLVWRIILKRSQKRLGVFLSNPVDVTSEFLGSYLEPFFGRQTRVNVMRSLVQYFLNEETLRMSIPLCSVIFPMTSACLNIDLTLDTNLWFLSNTVKLNIDSRLNLPILDLKIDLTGFHDRSETGVCAQGNLTLLNLGNWPVPNFELNCHPVFYKPLQYTDKELCFLYEKTKLQYPEPVLTLNKVCIEPVREILVHEIVRRATQSVVERYQLQPNSNTICRQVARDVIRDRHFDVSMELLVNRLGFRFDRGTLRGLVLFVRNVMIWVETVFKIGQASNGKALAQNLMECGVLFLRNAERKRRGSTLRRPRPVPEHIPEYSRNGRVLVIPEVNGRSFRSVPTGTIPEQSAPNQRRSVQGFNLIPESNETTLQSGLRSFPELIQSFIARLTESLRRTLRFLGLNDTNLESILRSISQLIQTFISRLMDFLRRIIPGLKGRSSGSIPELIRLFIQAFPFPEPTERGPEPAPRSIPELIRFFVSDWRETLRFADLERATPESSSTIPELIRSYIPDFRATLQRIIQSSGLTERPELQDLLHALNTSLDMAADQLDEFNFLLKDYLHGVRLILESRLENWWGDLISNGRRSNVKSDRRQPSQSRSRNNSRVRG